MAFLYLKAMRNIGFLLLVFLTLGCGSASNSSQDRSARKAYTPTPEDPALIEEATSEYEIVVIEPGFYNWLQTYAQPKRFYTQKYLENRNTFYVQTWNLRVQLAGQYDSRLYVLPIDYDAKVNYGYDLNYQLYHFFLYFQEKYEQDLGAPSRI